MKLNPADKPRLQDNRKQLLILIAFGAVYICWGGTYLGMRIAVETMPPFIMAGIRFLVAGSLLYSGIRIRGAGRPTIVHWKHAAIVGVLLLVSGNGLIAWAEQLVPSGVASLLVAMVPIWMILPEWLGANGKRARARPNLGLILGVLLGLAGIMILVIGPGKAIHYQGPHPVGIIALVAASLSWAGGSLYSRRADLSGSPLLAAAMQMLVGGALLLLTGTLLGEWQRLHLASLSVRSCLGLGYLIFFGSIVGYNAYIWLLKNVEPALVSTYAFVNPIVAVFLGWLVAGEQMTPNTVLAAVVIVTAVAIITMNREK